MAYLNARGTYGSIISGTPTSVVHFEKYIYNFMNAFTLIAMQEAAKLEEKIRTEGRLLWGDLANSLQVIYDPHSMSFNIGVPDEDAIAAAELEYGTPTQSPRALMRMAASEMAQTASVDLRRRLKEVLG